jgi:hypothetical protein
VNFNSAGVVTHDRRIGSYTEAISVFSNVFHPDWVVLFFFFALYLITIRSQSYDPATWAISYIGMTVLLYIVYYVHTYVVYFRKDKNIVNICIGKLSNCCVVNFNNSPPQGLKIVGSNPARVLGF